MRAPCSAHSGTETRQKGSEIMVYESPRYVTELRDVTTGTNALTYGTSLWQDHPEMYELVLIAAGRVMNAAQHMERFRSDPVRHHDAVATAARYMEDADALTREVARMFRASVFGGSVFVSLAVVRQFVEYEVERLAREPEQGGQPGEFAECTCGMVARIERLRDHVATLKPPNHKVIPGEVA